jgi:release factor glutamine methyltransferase
VLACDVSAEALAYTRLNAQRLVGGAVVQALQGSWCEPLRGYQGSLGGLISNPPYIPAARIKRLQEEVQRYAAAHVVCMHRSARMVVVAHVWCCRPVHT